MNGQRMREGNQAKNIRGGELRQGQAAVKKKD
jgi:hypothetical protein